MNEERRRGGLLDLLLLGAAAVIVLLLMVSAGGDTTTTSSPTELNLALGDQEINNCYGAGSCTTNAPVEVRGNGNTVGVLRLCVDRDGNGYQTNQPCGLGYTAVQP
jgi:hypothetical protein